MERNPNPNLAHDRARGIAELRRLLEGLSVAMVTTVAADDALHSRPMLLVEITGEGALVFLTHLSSQKVHDVDRDSRVNLSFVSARGDRYVSVTGTAAIAHDVARMRELWNPTYRAWFPKGVEDPDSAVVTVSVDRADHWNISASRFVRFWGVLKAVVTRRPAEAERGQIRLKPDTTCD